MSDLATIHTTVPAISSEMLAKVRRLEETMMTCKQVAIDTEHIIHGGMYARTVRVPTGVLFVGSLFKRATMLIVNGSVTMTLSDGATELDGYNVLPGSAGRKQAFITRGPVEVTMIFPTAARTVAEAEAEFTDEADLLLSRRQDENDTITITGE